MPPRSWCDSCDLSSSFARLRLRPARVLDTTSGAAFLHSDRVQRERVHIEERGGVREVDRDGAGPAILVHRDRLGELLHVAAALVVLAQQPANDAEVSCGLHLADAPLVLEVDLPARPQMEAHVSPSTTT